MIFVVALATLWVAAGSHCRLEVLTGFEFLSCCQHPEDERSPTHHEKECTDDGCAAVEQGFCKQTRPQHAPLKPLLGLVTWSVPMEENCQVGALDSRVSTSSSPPELSRIWQFFERTALPPRAPSFVS
jgi:hypothetical protein